MFFKYRPAQVKDLPECRRCLRDAFAYDVNTLNDLAALWKELIVSGAGNAAVIEDLNRPAGQRILWYCISVFVSADYAAYLRTDAPPILGLGVVARWREGCSPLLGLAEVRQGNSGGGLVMVALNSGMSPEVLGHDNDRAQVGGRVSDHTFWSVGGYRLNEALIEMYTDYEATWAEGHGFLLRTDYRERPNPHSAAWLAAGCSPRLYGTTRQEFEARVGSTTPKMFLYQPPCFFFSPLEQELLQCALFGDTDGELADALSVSEVTLKKRWGSIYERVAEVSVGMLGGEAAGEKRGMEKKRHLLQYLRHHPEELRPVCRPK